VAVGDLATLVSALGTFGSFLVSSIALSVGVLRNSNKERNAAAETAAARTQDVVETAHEKALEELLDKLSDGNLSAEEVAEIRDHLNPQHRKELG
jgi:hypothetical protein